MFLPKYLIVDCYHELQEGSVSVALVLHQQAHAAVPGVVGGHRVLAARHAAREPHELVAAGVQIFLRQILRYFYLVHEDPEHDGPGLAPGLGGVPDEGGELDSLPATHSRRSKCIFVSPRQEPLGSAAVALLPLILHYPRW